MIEKMVKVFCFLGLSVNKVIDVVSGKGGWINGKRGEWEVA